MNQHFYTKKLFNMNKMKRKQKQAFFGPTTTFTSTTYKKKTQTKTHSQ